MLLVSVVVYVYYTAWVILTVRGGFLVHENFGVNKIRS